MSRKRCPTPQKQAHPNEAAAKKHLGGIWASQGKAGGWSQHAYKCRCGSWHVGGKRKAFGRRRKQW